MAKKITDETSEATSEATYNGSELVRAEVGINKDILTVVLKPDGRYTAKQAEELVTIFLSRGVQ